MNFRIRGLRPGNFRTSSRFRRRAGGARRGKGNRGRPMPLPLSLTDSTPGDEVILPTRASRGRSPYRMRFAIYVRQGEKTFDALDAVPDQFAGARCGRGFDDKAMMTGWEVIEGISSRGHRAAIRRSAHGVSARTFRRAGTLCG